MPKNDSSWGLLIGIGSHVLVGAVLGLVVGQWLDRKFHWTPWGLVGCTLLGVASGMYTMIREGMRVNEDPKKPGGPRPGN